MAKIQLYVVLYKLFDDDATLLCSAKLYNILMFFDNANYNSLIVKIVLLSVFAQAVYLFLWILLCIQRLLKY